MHLIIINELLVIKSEVSNVDIIVKKKMIRILYQYTDLKKRGLWLNEN